MVVFVRGCYWQSRGRYRPKSQQQFWTDKLEANRSRDERNVRSLLASLLSQRRKWIVRRHDDSLPWMGVVDLEPRCAGKSAKPSIDQVIDHLANLDVEAKRLAEE
jgi:hypothetical protein